MSVFVAEFVAVFLSMFVPVFASVFVSEFVSVFAIYYELKSNHLRKIQMDKFGLKVTNQQNSKSIYRKRFLFRITGEPSALALKMLPIISTKNITKCLKMTVLLHLVSGIITYNIYP